MNWEPAAPEVCARCRHDAWHLQPHVPPHSGCVVDGCGCPSYRTEAQQEAWGAAEDAIALSWQGDNVAELVGALNDLKELYP